MFSDLLFLHELLQGQGQNLIKFALAGRGRIEQRPVLFLVHKMVAIYGVQ